MEKETFTIPDIQDDLKLSDEDMTFIEMNLWACNAKEINSNTLIASIWPDSTDYLPSSGDSVHEKCRLVPSAIFSYVDHQEIVQAREAAKESKRLAWIAIGISLGIGVLQVYLQWAGAN